MFCVFAINISWTLIAHVCDRLTYAYVRDNTFARNSNQIGPTNHQHNLQAAEQELSDNQNELLKIPLNAVRISLLSFLPLMILPSLILIIGDNVISPITKIQMGTILICIIQSLKIIIILTCLHKATEANQAEISQAKKRTKNLEWEQYHSFKARKAREQALLNNEPQPGTSSNQILDPKLLEQIMDDNEESSV